MALEIDEVIETNNSRARTVRDAATLITDKDLKIGLFEFAKEYKLELMNLKLNLIILCMGGIFTMLGYIVKILFEIAQKL